MSKNSTISVLPELHPACKQDHPFNPIVLKLKFTSKSASLAY